MFGHALRGIDTDVFSKDGSLAGELGITIFYSQIRGLIYPALSCGSARRARRFRKKVRASRHGLGGLGSPTPRHCPYPKAPMPLDRLQLNRSLINPPASAGGFSFLLKVGTIENAVLKIWNTRKKNRTKWFP